ncbi:hypothetical protein LI031_22740 [Enterocloster citroniae]|nr:hypothetical protein [Enterocloster citroniae]
MACNNLPSFQDDKGGHIFERLCVVPCTNTIEQERRDSALLDKMLNERNAIFNWFLEGLHRLIDHNFKITHSSACEEAIKDYREKLDTVFRYLSEFYIITGDRVDMVLKADFDSAYMNWCVLNEFAHVNKQNIRDRMEANGCPADKANMKGKRGVMVYRNLKQKDEVFQGVTQEEYTQGKIPFN